MTKQEMIAYCLTYPGVYEDYPFDSEWAAMRHSGNQKAFAFIYTRNGSLYVNLKCDPMEADLLRGLFEDVKPAYHMNKTHWNTIALEGNLPEDELFAMVEHSFRLTEPRAKKRNMKKQKAPSA